MASANAATAATRVPLNDWRDWRRWPDNLARLWRRSLRFRTILITLTLTALAVVVACVWMALAIQRDLFDSRLEQVQVDAQRATAAAQTTLNNAAVQGDGVQLQNLMVSVSLILAQQSSSDMIAAFRIGPPSPNAPQDFASPLEFEAIITDELRAQVREDPDQQWWQSVALPAEDAAVPGIVIGQQLQVPDVGGYELYLAYGLGDASQTLGFVMGTLWIVGVGLVLLISGIAWFVLRSVTTPIGEASPRPYAR